MNLSISNIAWAKEEEQEIIDTLKSFSVNGIEIAPTKVWDIPADYNMEEALLYKNGWLKHGIEPVAMQSLLFGQKDLVLFQDEKTRIRLKQYLFKIIELAEVFGTTILVFGSPKNRYTGMISKQEQMNIAVPFFHELGEKAVKHNVIFCMEPNAKEYGCDFITNTNEAIDLIKAIDHPGFKLHLDAAVMTMNNENYAQTIETSMPYLAHFHVSEPFLNLIGSQETDHQSIAEALISNQYEKWISIEMKNGLMDSNKESVKRALDFVTRIYK
ncbi:sugar phosphate isomerase/epimerase family protein [Paenibacillus wulumuqiensis]|uniref:sugar phosphate isomerase/epimerase family protein n=1 Tax=Paenibacillus wulumuqiensis TaxID=1567107 RepID=UPI0006198F9F|nr:TIM barrel protein [Paenibacillus wulumuqiensis]